jgi:hypothetical protein
MMKDTLDFLFKDALGILTLKHHYAELKSMDTL